METVNFKELAQQKASTQSARSKDETIDEEFEQEQKVAQAILKKLQDKKLAQRKT